MKKDKQLSSLVTSFDIKWRGSSSSGRRRQRPSFFSVHRRRTPAAAPPPALIRSLPARRLGSAIAKLNGDGDHRRSGAPIAVMSSPRHPTSVSSSASSSSERGGGGGDGCPEEGGEGLLLGRTLDPSALSGFAVAESARGLDDGGGGGGGSPRRRRFRRGRGGGGGRGDSGHSEGSVGGSGGGSSKSLSSTTSSSSSSKLAFIRRKLPTPAKAKVGGGLGRIGAGLRRFNLSKQDGDNPEEEDGRDGRRGGGELAGDDPHDGGGGGAEEEAEAEAEAEEEDLTASAMERMEMVRAARQATMDAMMEHLEEFLREQAEVRWLEGDDLGPTYEEWIAALHPENTGRVGGVTDSVLAAAAPAPPPSVSSVEASSSPDGGGRRRRPHKSIDHRFYADASDHRRMWNSKMPGGDGSHPRYVHSRGESPASIMRRQREQPPHEESSDVTASAAERLRMVRAAKDAYLESMREHLAGYTEDNDGVASYEGWIQDLFPEAAATSRRKKDRGGGEEEDEGVIDPSFYARTSEHRKIWNDALPLGRDDPRYVNFRGRARG